MNEEQGKVVRVSDILQIAPDCAVNPMFGGCMMIVSELKGWGVMGYVQALGENGECGGQAYIRLRWDQVEPTGGKAVWITEHHAERDENGSPETDAER